MAISGELREELGRRGIIAVLEIEDEKDAVPAAKALVSGGVTAIELALRTPAAMPSIALIAKEVPEMMIGIGTIIRTEQVAAVKEAGAHFGVAPGFNPRIVAEADRLGFPFAPGISTASELEGAVEMGNSVLKLFPAEPLGGLKYLKSMAGPYAYLGLGFIPLGGITPENLAEWASYDRICAIGGTWIAKKPLIKAHDWTAIERNAAEAVRTWKATRGEADCFMASYAGVEANVSVSLANYGEDAAFVTYVPDNPLGQSAINSLRRYGVDTRWMMKGGERLGVYFIEKGASQRASKVVYDRKYSSVAMSGPGDYDWDRIFEGADWFHWTGHLRGRHGYRIGEAFQRGLCQRCQAACGGFWLQVCGNHAPRLDFRQRQQLVGDDLRWQG